MINAEAVNWKNVKKDMSLHLCSWVASECLWLTRSCVSSASRQSDLRPEPWSPSPGTAEQPSTQPETKNQHTITDLFRGTWRLSEDPRSRQNVWNSPRKDCSPWCHWGTSAVRSAGCRNPSFLRSVRLLSPKTAEKVEDPSRVSAGPVGVRLSVDLIIYHDG